MMVVMRLKKLSPFVARKLSSCGGKPKSAKENPPPEKHRGTRCCQELFCSWRSAGPTLHCIFRLPLFFLKVLVLEEDEEVTGVDTHAAVNLESVSVCQTLAKASDLHCTIEPQFTLAVEACS